MKVRGNRKKSSLVSCAWSVCALFGLGSEAFDGSGNVDSYRIDPTHCSAPRFDPELEKSLCEADEVVFSNRIRRLWESRESADRKRAVDLVERAWRLDPTLGIGLPLEALDRDDFRVAEMEFLGPAIRGGESNLRLAELQKFAGRFARQHQGDDRTAPAVAAIGYSDASSHVQFVIHVARNNSGGARSSAIGALGQMCSDEAAQFLGAIQREDSGYSDVDRRIAQLGLQDRRKGAVAQWCARPQQGLTDL